eukprot:g1217.t1
MASEADTLERWFTIADVNRDGRIEGSEAITFFQRSGLPRDTLKEIWSRTAGQTPFMTKQQFYGAIRLVSLAQLSGGSFTIQQATQLLTGMTPPPPLPIMAGLTPGVWTPEAATPVSPHFKSNPSPPQEQFTGTSLPSGTPTIQVTGQAPSMSYSTRSNLTPQSMDPATVYPPLPIEEFTRFGQMFQSLDTDNDGFVQGGQCIELFTNRGVDRSILKQIWQVVAGAAGVINQDQFIKCLYLIEVSRRGMMVPSALPPGQFPPIAPSRTGYGANVGIPALPPKAVFQSPESTGYPGWRGPGINESLVASLDPSQRDRLMSERSEVQKKDEELFQMSKEAETFRQRREFFERALQELTLFKSRMDMATIEVQEQAKREQEAAMELENRYEQVRNGAEAAAKETGSHIQALNEAQNKKLELQGKLQMMQEELSAMEASHPETIQKLELEIQGLQEAILSTESRRNTLTAELESYKHQQGLLQKRQGDLQMACAAAEAEVHSASGDIDKLISEVETSTESKDIEQIQKLLREAARVYSNLYSHACKAGVEIPVEAKMSLFGNDLTWTDDLIATGVDRTDWEEDGFVLVDVFPDVKEDLDAEFENAIKEAVKATEANKTTPSVAAAAATLTKDSGFENAFAVDGNVQKSEFVAFDAFPEMTPPPVQTKTVLPTPPSSGFAVTFDEPSGFPTLTGSESTGFQTNFEQEMTPAVQPTTTTAPLTGFGFDEKSPEFEPSFPTVDFSTEIPAPTTNTDQTSNTQDIDDPFGGSAFA